MNRGHIEDPVSDLCLAGVVRKLKTQNSKLKTQNSKLKTQNSKRKCAFYS